MDFQSHAKSTFEVLTGGYAQKFDPQQGWQQVTGSRALRTARAKPADGSQRARHARQWKNWHRSEHQWKS